MDDFICVVLASEDDGDHDDHNRHDDHDGYIDHDDHDDHDEHEDHEGHDLVIKVFLSKKCKGVMAGDHFCIPLLCVLFSSLLCICISLLCICITLLCICICSY